MDESRGHGRGRGRLPIAENKLVKPVGSNPAYAYSSKFECRPLVLKVIHFLDTLSI